VANVRELHAICRNDRKSDRVDAEKLARFARLDPNLFASHPTSKRATTRSRYRDPGAERFGADASRTSERDARTGETMRLSLAGLCHHYLR
jgi:hypothetical protein